MCDTVQQDIRVTKTRKALTETMLKLLQQKKFQKITVNDICQEAMVSRSTFYLHFEDKYQLLQFCLQEERKSMRSIANSMEPKEFLHTAIQGIKDNQKMYYNLFQSNINEELLQMFQQHFNSFFVEYLEKAQDKGAKLTAPIPMLATFYSSGVAGLILWWIESGFQYSVEDMASCHYQLLTDIISEK